jgi:hypothetical protein
LRFAAAQVSRTGPTRHSLSESFGHLERAAGQTPVRLDFVLGLDHSAATIRGSGT